MVGTVSANLDTLIGGNLQVFFRVLDGSQPSLIPVQTYQHAVRVLMFQRGVRKTSHTVPAMCCRQHLNVVRMCHPQHQFPEFVLHGVVNAIFSLVDEQKTATTVGKRKGHTEQTNSTVTETPQWDRTILLPYANYRSSTVLGRIAISDYRDTEDIAVEYQLQRLHSTILVFRQCDTIPNASDVAFGWNPRSQTLTNDLWLRLVIWREGLMALEQ